MIISNRFEYHQKYNSTTLSKIISIYVNTNNNDYFWDLSFWLIT